MVNIDDKSTVRHVSAYLAAELRHAWHDSAPLTATSILMLAALVMSCAGIFLDSRIITGAPAWLKPAKFAISTAIFSATIAWLFRYITIWPRFVRVVGCILGVALVIEVAIIDLQAARGTTSHFNLATSLDAVLFMVMGTFILILWLASVAILVALFRQQFQNTSWGWWLRLGMLITVLGSAAGGMMLRVTPEQATTLHAAHSLRAAGGHTVGAPDGGPGLPVVGWSSRHGDLRIPHFMGLHGIQIIPLIGWLAMRSRRIQSGRTATRFAFAIAGSYLVLVGILMWQALRGQSIVEPDATTMAALAIWFGATTLAILLVRNGGQTA